MTSAVHCSNDGAQQLHNFLKQLTSTGSSGQTAITAAHNAQAKQKLTHIADAGNTISVLLKVPWFTDLAASGMCHIRITQDGNICCCYDSDNSSINYQLEEQQQQQQQAGTHAYYQILLATTVAKLAADHHHQQQQQEEEQRQGKLQVKPAAGDPASTSAADFLLQQLLPQCLSCPAACERGTLSSQQHWASILCTAAVQLAAQGNLQVADLAEKAIQELADLSGCRPDSKTGSRAAVANNGSSRSGYLRSGCDTSSRLSLGAAVSLALLSGLLESQGSHCPADGSSSSSAFDGSCCVCFRADTVEMLLQCVISIMTAPGSDLKSEVQAVLLTPLMIAAAAAAQGSSTHRSAYISACQQLLLAACGCGSSTAASAGSPTAARAGSSSVSSSLVYESLSLACRLQPHMLTATQHSGVCGDVLSELLLQGLSHPDTASRHRALHLLTAAVQAGQSPKVPGFTEVQWSAFMSIYRAQEEHVLHLVEPVWTDSYPLLWQHVSSSRSDSAGPAVCWISVLLKRAAFHSNVTMRRLGLAALFQMSCGTVQHIICHGGWQQLQQLLLHVLGAFGSDKLVSDVAAGSTVRRQAAAVEQLQQQLKEFLTNCLAVLQEHQQQELIGSLMVSYLDRVVEVSERAPSAAVLLQALSAAATVASSGKLLCDLGPDMLLTHMGGVLNHVSYLHPAHLRPAVQGSVMRCVPLCCSAATCTVEAALNILAAAEESPDDASAAHARRQYISWLQDVMMVSSATDPQPQPPATAAVEAAAAVVGAGESSLTRLQSWLQPLHTNLYSSSSSRQCLPQQQLMYSLGKVALYLSDGCQAVVKDVMTAAATAAAAAAPTNTHLPGSTVSALACLACGLTKALQQQVMTHNTSLASDHGGSSSSSSSSITLALIKSLQTLILVLLQHHNRGCTQQAQILLSTDWAQQLMQLVHNISKLHQTLQHQQQQQELYALLDNLCGAVTAQLINWQQQQQGLHLVESAASSNSLDQQFLNLVTAHIAAHALEIDNNRAIHGNTNSTPSDSSGSSSTGSDAPNNLLQCVSAVSMGSLIEALCQLQPADDLSQQWQQHNIGGSSSSSSKAELADQVVKLRTAVLAQVAAAAAAAGGPGVSLKSRSLVFERCLQDLEWTSDSPVTLTQLLQLLLLVAPYDLLPTTPHRQPGDGTPATSAQPAGEAPGSPEQGYWSESGVLEGFRALLNVLQPLVRDSRRLTGSSAGLLVRVFFHPALFTCRELQAILNSSLIPFTLTHGGVRLSVTLMTHLCSQVFDLDNTQQASTTDDSLQQQQQQQQQEEPGVQTSHQYTQRTESVAPFLETYLPYIAHMCAFSVFAKSVTAAAALQQQRCDAAVLLPARVVLCSYLLQVARGGNHPVFLHQLVHSLLDIAEGVGPYSWLQGREAGQGSGTNRIKVAVWQTLCLMAPTVDGDETDEIITRGWSCLLNCHMHSNIRPHVQLFMLCLFKKRPASVQQYLLPALNNFATTSYQVTVSVIIVVLFLLYECGPGTSPHFMALFQGLMPWALHHRHAVRVPVQVLLHLIFSRHMPEIQQQMGHQATDLLQQMYQFLSENDETVRLRERQALLDLTTFSLEHETSLEGVFGVNEVDLDRLCDGESDVTGLQWPLHVRDRLPMDILRVLPGAIKAVGNRFTNKPREPAAADHQGEAAEHDAEAACDEQSHVSAVSTSEGSGAAGGVNPVYQFRPQVQSSLFDDSSVDRVEALIAGRSTQPGLVVCASLLDNVPNLAGLCRTCESLSVESLVISNRSVAFTDAFKRQSVTSERWINLQEVGQQDVATFLTEKAAAGYTIIGVEQATNSVPLQSYTFPKRSVLLIGNEQNGVPVQLLPLLGVCLEIPMLGVTRSLNAHVSGAMVVWQYTQQHLAQSGHPS